MKTFRLSDTRDHISDEGLKNGSRLAPAKSVFVVVRGMILAKDLPVALAKVPMAFNQDMKALVARSVVDPEYLLYALAARKDALATAISTSAHGTRRMETASLESLLLPLPPKDEQQRIAGVLAKLEAAVEVQDRVARALSELKVATMAKLFREGTQTLRPELRQTPFGDIPAHWRVETLGSHGQIQTGVTKGRNLGDSIVIDVPYLRVANVQDGHIDLSEIKTIRIRASELHRYALTAGDVLLTEGGDLDKLGRGYLWNSEIPECVHQNHIFAVRTTRQTLLPEFLAYLVQSPYARACFLSVGHKTTNLACINTSKLKSFPVLLPTLSEQREIVAVLGQIDNAVRSAQQRVEALKLAFSAMLRVLMTGQVRVPAGLIAERLRARPSETPPPEVIAEIVRRIVEAVAPEKIILFGSAARGEMGPDSDLDLLVVKSCDDRREVARAVRACLRGVAPGRGKDVVVVTPEDVERDRDTIGYIIRPALREGRVLYAA
jgi:type I restriction enzyme S subunit